MILTNSKIIGGTLYKIVLTILILALTACGGGEENVGEKTRGESTQDETTREAASVGSYPLPGQGALLAQGIAYQESTGDFFVGSTANGAIFRGNVADVGEEAEMFLEPGSDGRTNATGMKVDEEGRLFIGGGGTARIFVYGTSSGDLIQAFDTPPSENSFINDVTIAPNGDAYFTDPERPAIFRVPVTPGEVGEPEVWLVPEEPPVEDEGFNIQGIAATGDGRYLIAVQSNVGDLLRIDLASKEVVKIDLGSDFQLISGAGLALDGQTLYATRSRANTIVPVELSEDFASGEVGEGFSNPSFRYPTTIAKVDDRLLVADFLEPTVFNVEIP